MKLTTKESRSRKNKGRTAEYGMVRKLEKINIPAKRMPLSGRLKDMKGDIEFTIKGVVYKGEVKRRSSLETSGIKTLLTWKQDCDALFIDIKGHGVYVLMSLETLGDITNDPHE